MNNKEYRDVPDFTFFQTRSPWIIGEQETFRSAVCIPLIETAKGYELLFQVRSNKIPDQPGDICFPGGRIEEGEVPVEAAVRELEEELLIDTATFELLGPMDVFHSSSLIIYPYVGILREYQGTFSKSEVAEVFTVPLDFFLNTEPERHPVKQSVEPLEGFPYERISGGKNYKWRDNTRDQLFYQYGNRCIWGITARMIHGFVQVLKEQ